MIRPSFPYRMPRIDGDGGATDLQTDVMRFMAILALCLVAIFALVQSLQATPPVTAQTPSPDPVPPSQVEGELADELTDALTDKLTNALTVEPPPHEPSSTRATVQTIVQTTVQTIARTDETVEPEPEAKPAEPPVVLRRPSVTRTQPARREPAPQNRPVAPSTPTREGFSLRFESDLALTRLVASGQIGLYAINDGRARRMSVRNSTVSFWDASTPGSFHEMDAATVPRAVVESLARSGADTAQTGWGVTLPGKLKRELDTILREHRGGELIIGADGTLRMSES